MVGTMHTGCLFVPLMMLVGSTFWADAKSVKEAEKMGNFMEDEQWLSTISQYSRKIKHWNRFRDEVEDDYVRTWEENQGSNENVDTTKDPCQKVKCSRHKVCIAQGYQRAVCVNRKKLEHRLKQPSLRSPDGACQPCPLAPSGPVCGSDGHNYASQCKLEQQACLTGKELTMKCSSPCPCPTTSSPSMTTESKHVESCTGQDLSDLGDRLRDWFQLLHSNAKLNNSTKPGASSTAGASSTSVLDKSLGASCKDSIGWMFSRLDTNADLYLDQAELAAINLDKYEVCIRPFFNSCDSYKDGKVSTADWCLCFWREKPPCLADLERIQVQEGGKRMLGVFIPSCDEDGLYRKLQCDRGECWCVDQQGAEKAGSRTRGRPDCGRTGRPPQADLTSTSAHTLCKDICGHTCTRTHTRSAQAVPYLKWLQSCTPASLTAGARAPVM